MQPDISKKPTKKWVLAEASKFWKKFGHLTFFRTKKEYLGGVMKKYKTWVNSSEVERKKMQERAVEDLKVRDTQATTFLDARKHTKKLETVLKSGVVR